MVMSEHLAVVLISNTETHLVLTVLEHSILVIALGEAHWRMYGAYCSDTMVLVLLNCAQRVH